MFWTIVACVLIVWLIVAFSPTVLFVIFWSAVYAFEKVGAFLGKLFPAYTPPAGT